MITLQCLRMSHTLSIHVLVLLVVLAKSIQARQSDLLISSTLNVIRYADFNQVNERMIRILREHTVGRSIVWRPNKLIDFRGFEEEREIAFLGGIKPELIRSVREYTYDYGKRRLVRIIMNPFYDVDANGENRVNPAELADIVIPPNCPVKYWSPPEIELIKIDVVEGQEIEEGGPLEDEIMIGDMLAKPIRSAFLNPKNHSQIYFFAANRFALMQALPIPNQILQGPAIIETEWPSLKNLNFAMVDAVLPATDSNFLHVFSQENYAHVNMDTHESFGPFTIVDYWPSLGQVGFHTVDAIIPHPHDYNVAYFFSRDSFALVKSKPDDVLLSGPHIIVEEWLSLKRANFSTIDVAVPRPLNESQAYFFSGNQYVVVTLHPNNDEIFNAPFTRSLESCWHSINALGFYGDLLDGMPKDSNSTTNN